MERHSLFQHIYTALGVLVAVALCMPLDLFDGAGRVAVSMAVRGGAAIDLGHLAPGAYTYRLWGPDGQAVAQGRWVKH